MASFGQFCPLAQATQLLCERWTLLVVRELVAGSTRFSELQKGVPLMSPTLLSARLKQLTEAGVITKCGAGGKTVYQLTEAGRELTPIVQLLGAWGHRWVQTSLVVEDLDASLLMWDMRRSVNSDAFPIHRIVVHFEYAGASEGATDATRPHWQSGVELSPETWPTPPIGCSAGLVDAALQLNPSSVCDGLPAM